MRLNLKDLVKSLALKLRSMLTSKPAYFLAGLAIGAGLYIGAQSYLASIATPNIDAWVEFVKTKVEDASKVKCLVDKTTAQFNEKAFTEAQRNPIMEMLMNQAIMGYAQECGIK